jgi:lipoic acid synthetase
VTCGAAPDRAESPGAATVDQAVDERSAAGRKPSWLRVKVPPARTFRATAGLLEELRLHTVCDEARCPNKGECFGAGTATFLILGDACTRDCRFCAVSHGAWTGDVDEDEPRRVAQAAARLGLRHVVVTGVTRDDLADGGAAQFADVVRETRAAAPAATVEVLTPDFGGSVAALETVLAAGPDVFNHNVETVPRLYAAVRPQADYGRSLEMLRRAAEWVRGVRPADPRPVAARGAHATVGAGGEPAAARPARPLVKTGLMLGLGETDEEVDAVLRDCVAAGVDVVTIGQYLRPAAGCAPVARYVPPAEFDEWARAGGHLGLTVVAGPLVRSSYRAGDVLDRGAQVAAATDVRAAAPREQETQPVASRDRRTETPRNAGAKAAS